jgi:hypothetical protein
VARLASTSALMILLAACAPEGEVRRASRPADPALRKEAARDTAVAPRAPETASPLSGAPIGDAPFADAAERTGLRFVHWNGMVGELHMVEMVGSGAALFDFDRDGDLDVWLVQGALLGAGTTPHDAVLPSPTPEPPSDRLFRNEMEPGRPESLRFADVTESAGIAAFGYGQGVAVGDVDGDGWPDVYLSNDGPDQLWRNRGDGTFENATELARIAVSGWSTSAAFLDFDRDGDLDLYVGRYLDATTENHFNCRADSGVVDYCGPLSFAPLSDVLLRNRGDGSFEDITAKAGVDRRGAALGVVVLDVDGDGWSDIYVANDQMENFLWRNQGDGTFRNEAPLAGLALNAEGKPEASMGVMAADLDGDLDLDLFLTHLTSETNTFYRNDGAGLFSDATALSGLGPPSLPYTSFGVAPVDLENDGDLDLFVANGTVKRVPEQLAADEPLPLRQPNQLFRNLGAAPPRSRGQGTSAVARFEEVANPGAAVTRSLVSRGVAAGDVDNDGDLDLVVMNNSGPTQLLLSQASTLGSWLGIELQHPSGLVGILGARLELTIEDSGGAARTLVRTASSAGSYLSAHDQRALFGLGAARARTLVVHWPDGSAERFETPSADRYQVIRHGSGEPRSPW